MKTPQLLVLLLTILMHAAVGFPSDRKEKQASWDDVNVVAHGLLQLGQGLKEHVDKSKAQMREVNAKLKAFNGTLAELEKKQREQSEDLMARSKEAEERERLAAELTEEMRVKVEEVGKKDKDIHSRVDRLEEKMQEVLKEPRLESNNSEHTGASFIQRLLAAQNRRIDQLVEKIQQQQDKMEKQNLHLQALTAASGVYTIQPQGSLPFNVLCEMTSEGGWTVIQKRLDGSQNFNQLWESYRRGFGNLNGEFWLGLENIHSLSKQGQYVLQVEVSNSAGQQKSDYGFHLDGEDKMFALHLQTKSESQENIMTSGASGVPFSTVDRDNDLAKDVNCAELLSGGWWFSSCGESNLNGRYPRRPSGLRRDQSRRQGMFWTSTKGQNTSVKTTLLKIAPATINQ
uniref:Angiopoietin like 4 n=1 Tax=Labrus bergylta TaxID=56723 RepID=A0A3Q3E0H0_9LABR